MAGNKPPKKPTAADFQRRPRPPATIDLAATEVHVENNPPEESAPDPVQTGEPQATPASEPPHVPEVIEQPPLATFYDEAEAQRGKSEFAGEPPHRTPPFSEAIEEDAEEPHRAFDAPPPAGFPWAVAGAAAGGGLVVAAMLLALAYSGIVQPFGSTQNAANESALSDRLGRLETQLAARNTTPAPDRAASDTALKDIATRIGKIETALAQPLAPASDPAMTARVSALELATKSLGEAASGLNGRAAEVAAAARESRERSEATAKSLAEIKSVLDQQQANTADKSVVAKIADRVAALESSTRAVEQKIETPGSTAADRDVRIAVLASALKNAVERGAPFTAELEAIKPLGANAQAVATLEPFASSGIPGATSLAAELAALVPAMSRAAEPSTQGGTFLDKLKASAGRLVRVRPADAPASADPAVGIDRIENMVAHADIAGALAELGKLPPNVRAPADAWIVKAQRRQAALAAAQNISADALNALAKPAL